MVTSSILSTLNKIEEERNIKIIFVCEAGSRAWGFESPDSDYDIRFLYVHPIEWYLSLNEKKKDTYHKTYLVNGKEFDLEGWEIRKALRLLKKSNPSAIEWLHSPIKYIETNFSKEITNLVNKSYSLKALMYHYYSMAKSNFREYLKGEEVRLKKYLYVTRPLLVCRWIEVFKERPPVSFNAIFQNRKLEIDPLLHKEIEALVEKKRISFESVMGPKIPPIHSFIEQEIERLSDKGTQKNWPEIHKPVNMNEYNTLFLKILDQYGKNI